jgi:hypothetical protein
MTIICLCNPFPLKCFCELEGRCSIQLSYERLSGQTSTSFGTKRVVLCPPVSEWQSDLEVAQLVEGLTLLVFHFLSLSGLGLSHLHPRTAQLVQRSHSASTARTERPSYYAGRSSTCASRPTVARSVQRSHSALIDLRRAFIVLRSAFKARTERSTLAQRVRWSAQGVHRSHGRLKSRPDLSSIKRSGL